MNRKKYQQFRVIVSLFVTLIVVLAVIKDSYLLASAGVLSGMAFMILVRSKTKIRTDEREVAIQEKAARMTYAVFTPTIGITAFLIMLPTKGGISAFSKGEWLYIESIGMILAYLTLLLITIYAISYYFLNKKYGGGRNEE